jgi:hypothetical protein
MLPVWKQAEIERGRRRGEDAVEQRTLDGRGKLVKILGQEKWCSRCKRFKPFREFGQSQTRKAGLAAYCLPCANDYMYERRLATVYGMSRDEYDARLAAQGGRCAICRNAPRKRRLAVDHNHKTGEIRGLLCTRCNQKLLGSGNDDPALLRRAADYLDGLIVFTAQQEVSA